MKRDAFDPHREIDPVAQGAGQAVVVARDVVDTAPAAVERLAGVAARAGVHGADQQEAGRELHRPQGPRNPHDPVLERFPQRLERAPVELHDLVEKQDAVVGQADFSGSRVAAPADERGVGRAVVRRAERTLRQQAGGRFEQPGDRMNGRRGDRFVERRSRQDAGQSPGEQGLAGAGRPDEQQVVAPGCRDLDCPPCAALAADVDEVERVASGPGSRLVGQVRRGLGAADQVGDDLRQRGGGAQGDLLDDAALCRLAAGRTSR